MKTLKLTLVIMAAFLITLGLSSTGHALHDGGVAHCDACHAMHAPVGDFLMKGSTPTDTCLLCHAGYGQLSADGSAFRSGGDFFWVTTDVGYSTSRGTGSTDADRHGHNIISDDHGILEDATNSTAPGGSYDSTYLGCNSCHDPHGTQGNVLLLYGSGDPAPSNYVGGPTFSKAAPVMVSAGRKTNVGTQTPHSAYGSGMTEWCEVCHTNMALTTAKHPVGTLGSTRAGIYNAYVSTGVVGGSATTSYWEKVPFETGATTPTGLSTSSTAGPTGSAKVSCITCHRAHATPFENMTRWDMSETLVDEDHFNWKAGTNDVSAFVYYGQTFAAGQRSLCNKCHAQD